MITQSPASLQLAAASPTAEDFISLLVAPIVCYSTVNSSGVEREKSRRDRKLQFSTNSCKFTTEEFLSVQIFLSVTIVSPGVLQVPIISLYPSVTADSVSRILHNCKDCKALLVLKKHVRSAVASTWTLPLPLHMHSGKTRRRSRP